jgi:spoIIIJ-associated protein
MSEEMVFEGQTEKDAVRAACQKLLVEPKMVEYEVLESKEATKTRFRTVRAHCKIQVTQVNRAVAPPKKEKSEDSTGSNAPESKGDEQRERRPRRNNDRNHDRNDGNGNRSRGPRRQREDKPLDPEMVAESAERAKNLVTQLLEKMGFEAIVSIEENDQRVFVHIGGNDPILFNEEENVLESIQYIANAAIHWKLRGKRIVVERAGARADREQELSRLAKEMAEKVKETGEEMTLQPMHSGDRRLVHQALNDVEGVTTKSEGTGGFRCIRILPE